MISGYFVWWYGAGLTTAYGVAIAAMTRLAIVFSLSELGRTLFDPWKNDVVRLRNASLADQIKVWQLNVASRIIGFLVRSVVMLVTLVSLALMIVLSGIGLALWVALPLLTVILPLIGVTRLFQ